MGKGDQRSKRGKIIAGTYGKTRSKAEQKAKSRNSGSGKQDDKK